MPNRESFAYKVKKAIGEYIEIKFVPDNHFIDEEKREIHLYEYVNTHDLKLDKLKKLGLFWFDCDYYEWDVFLHIEYKYGAKADLNLQDIYYDKCLGELKPKGCLYDKKQTT